MHHQLQKTPKSLQALRQWLCWRKVPKPLADGSIRIGKVPINPVKGILLAGWQEERHWLTFVQACKYHDAGKCDGIGFVFDGKEWFCGIDLDKCVDGSSITPWAEEIVKRCDSYAELSPSGAGLRIFVSGKPAGVMTKVKKAIGGGAAVEIFAGKGCFLTVTGNAINSSHEVKQNQPAIDWLMQTYFSKSVAEQKIPADSHYIPPASDQAILQKARSARNGALFSALYDHGDISRYGGDHSAADLALCSLLLYWCDGNAEKAGELFRASALMRPKWDEKHGSMTYGQQTMLRAAAK